MAGKLIQALRSSVLASSLTEAELRVLANCGRIESFEAGQEIITISGADERVFVLREGEVRLSLAMPSSDGYCGGEAAFAIKDPGETFGWGRWVRPGRIVVRATAGAPTTVATFGLQHLGDPNTLLKASHRMVQLLYARLQEGGICPPDVGGLLKMQHAVLA